MTNGNLKIILTPTYNRVNTLPKLYQSLVKQSSKNFTWLIIDDGSTDGTKDYINKIQHEELIKIEYVYIKNGGKARALNKAFSLYENATIFVVVDSDDHLLENAVSIIEKYLSIYNDTNDVGAFFFHYMTEGGEILKTSGRIIEVDQVMTRYEYNNKYQQNDGCVCYLGRAVKKYKYPDFDGEKYIGPTVIQMEMAEEYKMVFSPQVIGVAKYLEGGLSKAGRKLRIKNPKGMLYYSQLMIKSYSKPITRIKHAISLWAYATILNKKYPEVIKEIKSPILLNLSYIPGKILYRKWKKYV